MLNLVDLVVVGSPLCLFVLLVHAGGGAGFVVGAYGLKTHTSKKVVWKLSPQNPFAFISSLAQSSLLAVLSNISSLA